MVPSFFSRSVTLARCFTASATNAIAVMSGLCSLVQPVPLSVQKKGLSDTYLPTIQRSSTEVGIATQPWGVWTW